MHTTTSRPASGPITIPLDQPQARARAFENAGQCPSTDDHLDDHRSRLHGLDLTGYLTMWCGQCGLWRTPMGHNAWRVADAHWRARLAATATQAGAR